MSTKPPKPLKAPKPLAISPEDDRLLTLAGLLLESTDSVRARIAETLEADNSLNEGLFDPLLRLARTEGGSLRMTDLAAQCRATPSAATRNADRLERLGLAERVSCPGDRRVVHLSITDRVRRVVADALPPHLEMIRSLLDAALEPDEVDELERLLRKLRDTVHPCAAVVSGPPA